MTTLTLLAAQIENSAVGVAIAESRFAYPIFEGVHLIGLAVSIGLLFMIDLRLMGFFMPRAPLEKMLRNLRPFVLGGFVATFVSGGLLFWSSAERMLQSPAFAFKLLFLLLACVNAYVFEFINAPRHLPTLSSNSRSFASLPRSFRYAGFASLTLWTLTIAFGRLIPYLPAWS
jgi:hypothetical protein